MANLNSTKKKVRVKRKHQRECNCGRKIVFYHQLSRTTPYHTDRTIHTISYWTKPYHSIHDMPHRIIPTYHTTPYHTIPYYATLYHSMELSLSPVIRFMVHARLSHRCRVSRDSSQMDSFLKHTFELS